MTRINQEKSISGIWVAFLAMTALFSSCQKDYYYDSGLQNGVYNESSLEVLEAQPFFFDSLVQVIHLAAMDDLMNDSSITFFAPTDHSIYKAMSFLNAEMHNKFEDSLRLEDVPAEVWRKFLTRYIFRGKYMLKDITRRDASQLNVYPGMNLESWDGYIMNLGVLFSDYEGTKDVGPRQITITDIGDLADPVKITANVATSDMQTRNGIVHVLDDSHDFGFSVFAFEALVEEYIQ
jgi:hypothetical protein